MAIEQEQRTDDEAQRWNHIKETFQRNLKLHGLEEGSAMTQMLVHVEDVGRALSGIRESLASSAPNNGDQPESNGQGLEAAMERLCSILEQSGSPELRVVNKVPLSFLNVIQKQFSIMQNWMLPMIELLKQSDSRFEELEGRFNHAREEYDELLQVLQQSDIEENDAEASNR